MALVCNKLHVVQELPDNARPLGLGERGASSLRSRAESFRCVFWARDVAYALKQPARQGSDKQAHKSSAAWLSLHLTDQKFCPIALHRSDQMLSSEDSSDEEDFRDGRRHSAAEEGCSDADEPEAGEAAANGAPPRDRHLRGVLHPHEEHPPQSAETYEHLEAADAASLAGHLEGAEAGQSIAEGATTLEISRLALMPERSCRLAAHLSHSDAQFVDGKLPSH